MKKILCLCLFLASYSEAAFAQSPTSVPVTTDASGRSELVLIVPVEAAQDALYSRAKDWIFRTYNSGKTVEQFEDKATGHILVRALSGPVIRNGTDRGGFAYNLTIDVKENKARFFVSNIQYKAGGMLVPSGANLAEVYPANWPTVRKKSFQGAWDQIQEDTKLELEHLALSFQAALNTKAKDF